MRQSSIMCIMKHSTHGCCRKYFLYSRTYIAALEFEKNRNGCYAAPISITCICTREIELTVTSRSSHFNEGKTNTQRILVVACTPQDEKQTVEGIVATYLKYMNFKILRNVSIFLFFRSDALGTSIIDFFIVRILENQLLQFFDCPSSIYRMANIFS